MASARDRSVSPRSQVPVSEASGADLTAASISTPSAPSPFGNIGSGSKYSQLPHLNTSLEYPDTKVEVADVQETITVTDSLLASMRNGQLPRPPISESMIQHLPAGVSSTSLFGQRKDSGDSVHTAQIPPPSILSSGPSNSDIVSGPCRSSSSVSFQVPRSKTRGSISVRPAPNKSHPVEFDLMSTPSSRHPSGADKTTPKSAVAAEPGKMFTSPRVAAYGPATATVAGLSRRPTSPLTFELPERQHPLQHFTFPTEDSVPNQTPTESPDTPTPQQERGRTPLVRAPAHPVGKKTATRDSSAGRRSSSGSKLSTKTVISTPKGPVIPFTEYLSKEDDNKIHILIGATGSVATIKIPMIIEKLFKVYTHERVSIQLVVTSAAEHFLRGMKISSDVKIWRENEEWSNPLTRPGDPILHVELRKWADILLIAPISANSLAKIANGLADNLLTSIVRVWNPSIPIIIAPAMNTFMYTHPVTKKHLAVIRDDFKFIEVLRPIEKVLVCGDIGMGGMREWSEIVDILVRKLKLVKKMERKKLEQCEGEGEEVGRTKTGEKEDADANDDEEGAEDEDEDEDEDENDDDDDDDDDDDEDDDDDDEDDDDDDEEEEEDDDDDDGDDDDEEDDDEEEEDDDEEEEDSAGNARKDGSEQDQEEDSVNKDIPEIGSPSTNPYILRMHGSGLKVAERGFMSLDDLTLQKGQDGDAKND